MLEVRCVQRLPEAGVWAREGVLLLALLSVLHGVCSSWIRNPKGRFMLRRDGRGQFM